MLTKLTQLKPKQQLMIFFVFTIAVAYIAAFILATPAEIVQGMGRIFLARDVLITDYFVVAGVGASFFNAALVMTLSLVLLIVLKLNFTGITIAAMMITGGFAFFGKNPLNILPIIFGSYLYAKVQGVKLNRYIYISLFATGLAPLVTELSLILRFPPTVNLLIAIAVGILVGFVIPPLSSHTVSMHMGYNLFNVGFAAGIIGLGIVSVLRSFGYSISTTLIWHGGRPGWLVYGLLGYFLLTMLYGWILSGKKIKPLFRLFKHPGRAVADFVLMDGVGTTLMNMGLVGIVCVGYILCIKGDLSGPVLGAILTIFGFGAFGIHICNYLPVLLGVFAATTLKVFDTTTPAMQLAAIFSGALAPIAGQFGIIPGLFAGFLHSSVVMVVGMVYGGMNLYNNGFAAGFVAIIMIPIMESFIKRYQER